MRQFLILSTWAHVVFTHSFDREGYEACLKIPLTDDSGLYRAVYPTVPGGSVCNLQLFNVPPFDISTFQLLRRGSLVRGMFPLLAAPEAPAFQVALKIARRKRAARQQECFMRHITHSAIPAHYCTFLMGRRPVLVMEYIEAALSVETVQDYVFEANFCSTDGREGEEDQESKAALLASIRADAIMVSKRWHRVLQEGASLLHLLHKNGYVISNLHDKKVAVVDTNLWKLTNANKPPNKVYFINLSQILPAARAATTRAHGPTYSYAPEQAQAESSFAPRSLIDPFAVDWYRLGFVLYEMVTGWMPFITAPDKDDLLAMVAKGVEWVEYTEQRAHKWFGTVQGNNAELIYGLLNVYPEDRYNMHNVCQWLIKASPKYLIPECEVDPPFNPNIERDGTL